MSDLNPVAALEPSTQVPIPDTQTTPSPEPKADAPKPDDASAASEKPKAPTEPEAPQKPDKDDSKPRRSVQERIDQLTAQRRAAEARAQIAERRLAELQRPLQQPDPSDYDATNAHQIRTAIREERRQDLQQEYMQAAQQAFEVRKATFETKLDAAKERIPDIAEIRDTFYRTVPIGNEAAHVLAESEKAAEITAFLVKNPAEAMRIADLPPQWQAVEIARLEGRVSQAPPVKRVSQAPEPPPILGGGSPAAARDPADMDMSQFASWWRARKK